MRYEFKSTSEGRPLSPLPLCATCSTHSLLFGAFPSRRIQRPQPIRRCLSALQVVITVFAEDKALSSVSASAARDCNNEDGEGPTLTFNLYCFKLSQSVDIDLPHAMQKMMTGEMLLTDFPFSASTFVEGDGILMTNAAMCFKHP